MNLSGPLIKPVYNDFSIYVMLGELWLSIQWLRNEHVITAWFGA